MEAEYAHRKTYGEARQSNPPGAQKNENRKWGMAHDAANIVLTTLEQAAQLAPIPYLKEAAGLAISVLQMVQDMKGNQESFKQLSADACGLVYTAYSVWEEQERDGKRISSDLMQHLSELCRHLHGYLSFGIITPTSTIINVEKFARDRTARSRVQRFISNKSDAGKIQEYRAEIKYALDRFSMQSHIAVRDAVSRIKDQQQAILDVLEQHKTSGDPPSHDIIHESQRPATNYEPSHRPTSSNSTQSPPRSPGSSHYSAFGNVVTNGNGTFTSIAGDYVVNNNRSTTTTNSSGNITNINMTNSNNNYSVRNKYGGQRRRGRKRGI